VEVSTQYCNAAVPGVKGSDEIGDIEMEEIEEEGGVDVDVKMMDVEGDVEMDDA